MSNLGEGLGTAYPGALDDPYYDDGIGNSDYANGDNPITDSNKRVDAEFANDVIDAILALQAELGVDPAGADATVADRLDSIETVSGDFMLNVGAAVVDEAVVVFDGTTGETVKEVPVTINSSGDIDTFGNFLTNGDQVGYSVPVYGAGTSYTLTTTPALVDLGTTDPSLTIDKAGTYLILATCNVYYNGTTFAAERDITLKLRRTNNTAADISNSVRVLKSGTPTVSTQTFAVVALPQVVYTTVATDDVIALFADVSVAPSAGTVEISEANILIVRLY